MLYEVITKDEVRLWHCTVIILTHDWIDVDHLPVNFHYTLLESKTVKHEYKRISSDIFVNDITDIGTKYNYNEAKREVELYDVV